ncbi:P-loop containing nucleoside triphosphate hydrolase protein [Dactylonectria estremocensis]|uniref:P-loop containing nucleoside triphosphate hydrolase protein n=1 Tax=Dactylonectria estremocensis TaxID=1079267 RepID=A0A9P9F334_9HYPO|nr:P-loop containing nucleoside triphosphate hydrolase protein [Dactylonectria estremocensis]
MGGSDTMESVQSRDDDTSSVVIVTPAEPVEAESKSQTTKEAEAKSTESTDTDVDEKENDDEEKKDGKEETKDDEKDDEEDEKEKEKVIVGLVTDSKDLYAKYDKNGDRSWTDKYPDDLEEAAENEETQKYAVIIRKIKPKEADSTKPLVIDSLIVQSPYLKRVLGKVFDGYPGIVTEVTRLKFHAPFECFVHRWDRLIAAKDDSAHDDITREHVELLYNIMKNELGEVIQLREDYFKNRAVAFEHVWTLFPPGCTVWGSSKGKPVAVKFNSGYYAKTQCGQVYLLQCKILDWDGKIMGWTDLNQQIGEFPGTVPFSQLNCYPLEYHPRLDAAMALLLDRGRRFEELAGYCYKFYKGTAVWHVDARKSRKENVQSRIVIDGENWEKENPDHTVWLENIHQQVEVTGRGGNDSDSDSGSENDWGNNNNDDVDDILGSDKRPPLTEEQLIMTSPIVRGYSLKNKRWMEFFIDDVSEVKFNDQAFNSLVLPEDQKELILAFAQSQVKYKDAFDDIISGKGKGIIMLLSGGPGIGKTLTAESVAEEMKVPLYIMSAGDLGADAYEVEDNLSRILEMVANWNAVLLLDECDVFLEARCANDIARNRIVSIFLRTLEYYEGILFLTTNRVKNMDPAFQSRIHMSLEYPPLDASAREAVWRGFLSRTINLNAKMEGKAAHEISEDEIKALAHLELNGRQIKNVLKTSNLLACHKGEKLAFRHLRIVLKVEGHSL